MINLTSLNAKCLSVQPAGQGDKKFQVQVTRLSLTLNNQDHNALFLHQQMSKNKTAERHKGTVAFLPVPCGFPRKIKQIVTGPPEQQHGCYLNDAHQGRFHHQDALGEDGDGVSKLGNLQQRERGDEGLHGKEPSLLCKAKQPVDSLQRLQEMNVWLCKGHWCAWKWGWGRREDCSWICWGQSPLAVICL